MPLKLYPPREGKSKNYSVRGTYLGIGVDKSCGTHKRSVAHQFLKDLEAKIERGEYPERKEAGPDPKRPTFVNAAIKYMEMGGERRYISTLIKHFGETLLEDIDQDAIDECAKALYPNTSAATRNRCVYTPVSAIFKRAKRRLDLERPIGSKGRTISDSLPLEDAAAIIRRADAFDKEYALLLLFLLYTGCRLGEALGLTWDRIDLERGTAWIPISKNGDPKTLKLRRDLSDALARHPKTNGQRVFRFRQGGWLKSLLLRARLEACGQQMPKRTKKKGVKRVVPDHRLSWVNHHSFRHTWATWMRRYGGLDLTGLKATKQWRDERSAARYAHADTREEWDRVEKLPSIFDVNVEGTNSTDFPRNELPSTRSVLPIVAERKPAKPQ